jgi:hypothetical protein
MLEAYAFLAAFTAQILAISVLHPAWLIRYARAKLRSYPSQHLAQLYPGVERRLALYRALSTSIAVLGLLLLGWLFRYTRRPDWEDGPVEALISVYFVVQALPLCLAACGEARFDKELRRSLPEEKRKAILQRRSLFDFVSPSIVFLAGLSYFLFAAFVLHIERDPFPGFAGYLVNIGAITLVYALTAFGVFTALYGRRAHPLERHADRVRAIGLAVKFAVYSCIACVAFLSLNFTLVLLDSQRWEPFAQSLFFVTCALLYFMGRNTPPHQPANGLGSTQTPEPASRQRSARLAAREPVGHRDRAHLSRAQRRKIGAVHHHDRYAHHDRRGREA